MQCQEERCSLHARQLGGLTRRDPLTFKQLDRHRQARFVLKRFGRLVKRVRQCFWIFDYHLRGHCSLSIDHRSSCCVHRAAFYVRRSSFGVLGSRFKRRTVNEELGTDGFCVFRSSFFVRGSNEEQSTRNHERMGSTFYVLCSGFKRRTVNEEP
jgi:hypothetical protein